MTTTTPAEIHRVISAALDDRAKLLRHDAASRKWKGPDFAGVRDGYAIPADPEGTAPSRARQLREEAIGR